MQDHELFQKRLAIAQEILIEKRLMARWQQRLPSLRKGLSMLGVRIPPPFFADFRFNLLSSGVYFGVFWGGWMWIFGSRPEHSKPILLSIAVHIGISILVGVLFGAWMAAIYRWRARKLGLPKWSELATEARVFD